MNSLFQKIIFILIVGSGVLLAHSISAEQKIYHSIFRGVFPHKNTIEVWTDDEKKKNILRGIRGIVIVPKQKDADILLIVHDTNVTVPKIKFVSSYTLLKRYKDDAIGGFYWKKGRPNLLFLANNLRKYKLKLTKNLEKYVDEDL